MPFHATRTGVGMTKGSLPPILVVDDNQDNAEIIRQYLEIRGYPVTVAHSGDEALTSRRFGRLSCCST